MSLEKLEKENAELRARLDAIKNYPPDGVGRTSDGYPSEVVYDEYAYKRMVDSYREAATLPTGDA